MTEEQRVERERLQEERLLKLEREILAGRVKVIAGEKPEFDGWSGESRGDWCDGCAYRALASRGSAALRQAAARQQPDRMRRQATR